jgi:hypothetical protein
LKERPSAKKRSSRPGLDLIEEEINSEDDLFKNKGCSTGETKVIVPENEEHGMKLEKPKSWFSNTRMKFIPLIAYPYCGAFMASISTMMVRVFTGFASEDPPKGHDTNFYGMSPYVFGFLLIFCSFFSYWIVNKGLEAFESVYVAPLFKVGGMIFNLTTGGYMLDEFSDYDGDDAKFLGFLSGC